MKVDHLLYRSVLTICVILLLSCSTADDGDRSSVGNSLVASVSVDCSSNINYQDDNGNVYAYRADDIFGVVSIQAGGHSTADESTDLGLNIFGADPLFGLPELSTYEVDGSSGQPGTAYIFYIDRGVEYISTDTNLGRTVRIERLTLDTDGSVTELIVNFSNVEMYNTSDPDDLLCIGTFQLSFSAN